MSYFLWHGLYFSIQRSRATNYTIRAYTYLPQYGARAIALERGCVCRNSLRVTVRDAVRALTASPKGVPFDAIPWEIHGIEDTVPWRVACREYLKTRMNLLGEAPSSSTNGAGSVEPVREAGS